MKKSLLFVILLVAFGGVVNGEPLGDKNKTTSLTKEQMNKIFSNYVSPNKDSSNPKYVVSLTRKKAADLGISSEEYKKNMDYIKTMNDTLAAQKKRGYSFERWGEDGYSAKPSGK